MQWRDSLGCLRLRTPVHGVAAGCEGLGGFEIDAGEHGPAHVDDVLAGDAMLHGTSPRSGPRGVGRWPGPGAVHRRPGSRWVHRPGGAWSGHRPSDSENRGRVYHGVTKSRDDRPRVPDPLAAPAHRPGHGDAPAPARDRRHGRPGPVLDLDRAVVYSQNHDQVGNRPVGDRPRAEELPVRAACLLFAPHTPLRPAAARA